MKKFKIEKNIKIPKKSTPYTVFPVEKMEVGDSFFVHKNDFKIPVLLDLQRLVYSTVRKYTTTCADNKKFSIHRYRELDGVRVFRTQ